MRVKLDSVEVNSIRKSVSSTLMNKNVVTNAFITFPDGTSITSIKTNASRCKVLILLSRQILEGGPSERRDSDNVQNQFIISNETHNCFLLPLVVAIAPGLTSAYSIIDAGYMDQP